MYTNTQWDVQTIIRSGVFKRWEIPGRSYGALIFPTIGGFNHRENHTKTINHWEKGGFMVVFHGFLWWFYGIYGIYPLAMST